MTSRVPWLAATVRSLDGSEPWAVVARDESDRPVGAVLLVDDPDGTTRLIGTDDGQRGAVLAMEPAVGRHLGAAVVRAAVGRARHALDLGPLLPGRVVTGFAAGLGVPELPAASVPLIERTEAGEVTAYLSHGTNRTLRKAHNRLRTDGLAPTVEFSADAGAVVAALPDVERCHRDRDHAHGRVGALDDRVRRGRWHCRMGTLAAAGSLELATLRFGDLPVAYVVGAPDGDTYHLLEGRFITKWARYSPGRLLESAVVQRMLDDQSMVHFDWMTSGAADSLLAMNALQPAVDLRVRFR